MNIEDLWIEKSEKCKNLIGAVAVNNFDNRSFMILSNKEQIAFTPNTEFQAASLSKLIGVIVTSLYLRSKGLSLDMNLSGLLATEVNPQTNFNHIFSHSAGINTSGFPGYEQAPAPTLSDIIQGSSVTNTEEILYNLPFSQFAYSGGRILFGSRIY